jgi:hypothetical protein
MTMINSNVMRAIGEVLSSHHIVPAPGENITDTVARALDLSDSQVSQWFDALTEGCTVEEANARVGIANHRDEALLVAIARVIGSGIGKLAR